MRRRTFDEYIVPKPRLWLTDVVTTLRHFALVTYTIDPDALRRMLPPRLSPLTIELHGTPRALLSVVLFMNTDFRPAVIPGPRFTMPQINYRAYVIDESTGEHAIWFLATLLDAWAFLVPRFIWRMPWRKGPIRIEYEYDDRTELYKSYSVTSHSTWAPANVELIQDTAPPDGADAADPAARGAARGGPGQTSDDAEAEPWTGADPGAGADPAARGATRAADSAADAATDPSSDPAAGADPAPTAAIDHDPTPTAAIEHDPNPAAAIELPGFPDVETGLVCLTHVPQGFFRRSDGKIAVNRVWHKRIPVKPARLVRATFPLLERLELVSRSEQAAPYSVLLAPEIEFLSHLPPKVVGD